MHATTGLCDSNFGAVRTLIQELAVLQQKTKQTSILNIINLKD